MEAEPPCLIINKYFFINIKIMAMQTATKTKISTVTYTVLAVVIAGSAIAVGLSFINPGGLPATIIRTCSESAETANFDVPAYVMAKNPKYFNPNVKSRAAQKPYGAAYEDTCLIDMLSTTTRTLADGSTRVITVAKSTKVDSCSAADEDNITKRNCRLQEGFCTGSSVSNYVYKCPNGCANGACIQLSGGTLTITNLKNNNIFRVVDGTQYVKLGEWQLKATDEAIDITELHLQTVNASMDVPATYSGDNTMLTTIYLKLDGNAIGNPAGYNSVAGSGLTVFLDKGVLRIPNDYVGKVLSVWGDVTPMGPGANTNYNAAFKVGLWGADSFVATGVSTFIPAKVSIDNATTTPMIVNKSAPVITLEPLDSHERNVLGRIKITADGGPVGIYRLTFNTMVTNPEIEIMNGALYLKSCTDGSCNIAAGQQISGTQTAGVVIGSNMKRWDGVIDSTLPHGMKYLNIPQGASAVIELRAFVAGTSGNVLTTFLADLPYASAPANFQGAIASAYQPTNRGNLVWTDFANPTNGIGSPETLPQWFNGYGLTSGAYVPLPPEGPAQNLSL